MEMAMSGLPNTSPERQIQQLERPQTEPLPRKRGEIGYVEGEDTQVQYRSPSSDTVLPPRHPADRDHEEGAATDVAQGSSNTYVPPNPVSTNSGDTSSIDSTPTLKRKGHYLFRLFHKHKILGVSLSTLSIFILLVGVLTGSVIGWVFAARLVRGAQNRQEGSRQMLSSFVLMHIVFGIATFAQLALLERRVFRIRAERYSHVHPGEMLPSYRRFPVSSDTIAFAPWNRPPLPTYAAALAQSGRGTGDVEDNIIAQEPPPVYGNTRGSTFLLSGPLGINVQRPPSVHSVSSMAERPKSYVSRDEEWEIIQDAERARSLEHTLRRLEGSLSQTSGR